MDASFAVGACLLPDGMERLREREAVAPPLFWSEALSALHQLLWRREISAEQAALARATLSQAPISRCDHARLHQEAWAIAERLGWAKTYDAEYVALARLQQWPLLTIDARLAHGAKSLIEILTPLDL